MDEEKAEKFSGWVERQLEAEKFYADLMEMEFHNSNAILDDLHNQNVFLDDSL